MRVVRFFGRIIALNENVLNLVCEGSVGAETSAVDPFGSAPGAASPAAEASRICKRFKNVFVNTSDFKRSKSLLVFRNSLFLCSCSVV